jgi:hypothetical protein
MRLVRFKQEEEMFNRRFYKVFALLCLVVAVVSGYVVFAQSGDSDEAMRFEVAEDGLRFAFGSERLYPDGMPAYGTPFVTQGYIYPEGTLNGSNGVLEDGSPEFPDKVLGTWTCYGYMIGEAGHATTGEWVVSTQVYNLHEQDAIIVTNGFELADLNVAAARAVTGGTGEFSEVRGEQTQELLGFTETMGVNLLVEFHLSS